MKKINNFQKPKVSWLKSETLNQRRGLTNVLARHQAGDACIRGCHSRYGMWHSVAPAPVAWCILMSKMLWVRVTQHGWYGTEKPPSITGLSEGTSQSIGFFGIHLVPLRSCSVTFHVSTSRGMTDMAWSQERPQTSPQKLDSAALDSTLT